MELSNAWVCYQMEVKRSTSNMSSRSSNSGCKWLKPVLFLVFLAGKKVFQIFSPGWLPDAIGISLVVPVPISVLPGKLQGLPFPIVHHEGEGGRSPLRRKIQQ